MAKPRKNHDRFHCYKITCIPNKKGYVGIASNGVAARWRQHKHDATKGANTPLHSAIRKYGPKNFVLEILAETDTWEDICEIEKKMIQEHNTLTLNGLGYNVSTGGEGPYGVKRSEKTKRKLSQITKQWLSEDPARIEHLRNLAKKQMSDPKNREISREGARKMWRDPQLYKNSKKALEEYWNTEDAQEIRRRNQKKVMSRPGMREHLRQKAIEQMKNPENREKSRRGALKQWQNKEFQEKMRVQMKRVARKNWENEEYRSKMKRLTSKPVMVKGTRYNSLEEAAAELDIRSNSLCYRLKSPNFSDYYYLPPSRYVIVNNIKYSSVNAAAKANGISHPVCLRRLKDPNFPEYQIVEEDD